MNYNQLLQEVISEANNINIPISKNIHKTVKINTRATSRFAQCKYNRIDNFYTIEISSFMNQASIGDIKETLAHEILHTCPDCMNHGVQWKAHASKMKRSYGYDIGRTGNAVSMGITVPKQQNYVLQCQKCKKEHARQRMSEAVKNPERFACKCGGKLKLI